MAEENNFKYTYRAPTEEERREIEAIKKEYSAPVKSFNKLDELKKLDKQVKTLPQILGITLGVIGVLCFGGGMAMVMALEQLVWGIVISLAGALLMAAGYFLYKLLLKRNKEKYAKRILELTDELLGGSEK